MWNMTGNESTRKALCPSGPRSVTQAKAYPLLGFSSVYAGRGSNPLGVNIFVLSLGLTHNSAAALMATCGFSCFFL